MKPGSIIVLIIAVVLVIAGVVTCLAGASMAKNNGREQGPATSRASRSR